MKPKALQNKKLSPKKKLALPKKSKTVVASKTLQKKIKTVLSRDLLPSVANGLNDGRKKRQHPKVVENTTILKDKKRNIIEQEDSSRAKKGTNVASATASKKVRAVSTKRQKVDLLEVPELPYEGGTLFGIGANDIGQLGLGQEIETKKRPGEVKLPFSVVDIACGGMHSVCLTKNGEVYTFGCNDEGALGRSTEAEGSEYIPKKVDIPEVIVQISAGDSHTAALSKTGQVYIWGNFRDGQGSMGLTVGGQRQPRPIQILTDFTIVKISSGNEHLACLTNEGKVYTCGCGETGQLGRITERCCKGGGRKGLGALLTPGLVHVRSGGKTVFIEDIWTGSYSTFARAKTTATIYAFGLNNFSHLGFDGELARFSPKLVLSFSNRKWVNISGGQHHTLALDSTGHVYVLGRKEYGRLGLGENCEDQNKPTIIPLLEQKKCIDISSGNVVSYAIAEDGSVYSWGMGTTNQLGHGNDDDVHVPTVIAGNFASWKAFRARGGGQHALILAQKKDSKESR